MCRVQRIGDLGGQFAVVNTMPVDCQCATLLKLIGLPQGSSMSRGMDSSLALIYRVIGMRRPSALILRAHDYQP